VEDEATHVVPACLRPEMRLERSMPSNSKLDLPWILSIGSILPLSPLISDGNCNEISSDIMVRVEAEGRDKGARGAEGFILPERQDLVRLWDQLSGNIPDWSKTNAEAEKIMKSKTDQRQTFVFQTYIYPPCNGRRLWCKISPNTGT
jgi:hypothetical protein